MIEDKTSDASATVQVAYVDASGQYLVSVAWFESMTAMQALTLSGLLEKLPADQPLHVGIFALKVENPEQHIMQIGDRLEIYRPLTRNPMDIRRKRAQAYPVGRIKRKL